MRREKLEERVIFRLKRQAYERKKKLRADLKRAILELDKELHTKIVNVYDLTDEGLDALDHDLGFYAAKNENRLGMKYNSNVRSSIIEILQGFKDNQMDFSIYDIQDANPEFNVSTIRSIIRELLEEEALEIVEEGRGQGNKTYYQFMQRDTQVD